MSDSKKTSIDMIQAAEWVRHMLEAGKNTRQANIVKHAFIHCNRQDWGSLEEGRAIYGTPLCLHGKVYEQGLGTHANSEITVTLPGPARRFRAIAGIDDNTDTRAQAFARNVFSLETDGNEIWHSSSLGVKDSPASVDVDLGGATRFTLKVTADGNRISYAHADWADAVVVLMDGTELRIGGHSREIDATSILPFSFNYGGRPSGELLPAWKASTTSKALGDNTTQHTLAWQDPDTGLECRCALKSYSDFPTVEWTVYFTNKGNAPTPILENILPLDIRLHTSPDKPFVLHHANGSNGTPAEYGPGTTTFQHGLVKRFSGLEGRPSDRDLPYFNLDMGGHGIIAVVGWPGQWFAEYAQEINKPTIRIRTGQETAHFKLLPGETVRTPLIVLQFWADGQWTDAQNVWRRWMNTHNLPRTADGNIPSPMLLGCSSRCYNEMCNADDQSQIMFMDRYEKEGIKLDYWWMDAGWYKCANPEGVNHWWNTGTWEIDPKRFPRGFKPVSEQAHLKGTKILVWFEPERVRPNTWLANNHPEWILGGADGGILNLGNPEAWSWLVNHVNQIITENGIDLYRQDFNTQPLVAWQKNDEPDRQGITEIKHVMGYLAYWDELRKRHPGMLIDSCASGGRRNDLETLRRAIPLWRTDVAYQAEVSQGITYGMSLWIPYFGTGTVASSGASYLGAGWTPVEEYAFWSNACPSVVLTMDIRELGIDYESWRRLLAQWRKVNMFYQGDFHPLTSYHTDADVWMAWQFYRQDMAQGMIQIFRRPQSPYQSASFQLRGLDPQSRYRFEELDGTNPLEFTGNDIMEHGLMVVLKEAPSVKVLTYQRVP